MRIGIDLMGSENSPIQLFQAVCLAAESFPSASFCLFASQAIIDDLKTLKLAFTPEFFSCDEIIEREDDPLLAIRRKRKSSIILGLQYLEKSRCDAFISAGNTGALVGAAALTLPPLPKVSRPALMALLPSPRGFTAVIDVGGNISCSAQQLEQFALVGAAYQSVWQKNSQKIKVGLLNIGAESKKGSPLVRSVYEILSQKWPQNEQSAIVFVGNIEARELFQGAVDVLVTDGFSGNILLKTAEGISAYIFSAIKGALALLPQEQVSAALEPLESFFHYEKYPGAIVAGVDALVIKCHGSSSDHALFNAIKGAIQFYSEGLLAGVKSFINE